MGMAIRRRRLASTVVGFSRKVSTLRRAKRRGAIDVGTSDVKRAVREADLVVLATPVDDIVPIALRAAKWMPPGSVLTDVGSTKGRLVSELERRLPSRVAFVGAHPLAGSEQRGIDAAHPRLFDGAVCILTSTPRTSRRALRIARRLWTPLTGRVVTMSPEAHDQLLGATSHLPHLLAYALVNSVNAGALAVTPPSFLELTRIAKSPPDLWDDILFTNRRALLGHMARFDRHWNAMRRCLSRHDQAGLLRLLARAKAKRDALD